jgi:TM2 domain-containing membrane protein YozV
MSKEPVVGDVGGYGKGLGYALWCGWFAGLAGLHRIYLGKYGTGILWMLTFGLFGIGQIYDLFSMKRLVREANIRAGYLPHPRWAGELERMAPPLARLPEPQAKPLKHQLLDAAIELGGELSVTEGVAATGASFEDVEDTLNQLLETGYIDIDNRPGSGVIVYRFTEL